MKQQQQQKKRAVTALENPYWEEIKHLVTETGSIPREYDELRWRYCNRYTMAVPDPETVALVARFLDPRAVEIGAGTGYWAWLMRQLGIDMLAYDSAPPDQCATNRIHSPYDFETCTLKGELRETFAPVQLGGPEVLATHTDRVLFVCWPPYRSSMAVQCLKSYAGSRLVYVGEGYGDSCATGSFFDRLQKDWREIETHWLVRWGDQHDRVTVYERKKRGRGKRESEQMKL